MNKAFTLIELVVVLAIISIFVGGGYITYNRSSQEKILVKDAEDLGSVLSLSKERAIRRDISPSASCTDFRGYDVLFNNAAQDSYNLRFICTISGTDTATTLNTYILKNTDFVIVPPRVPFFYPFGCIDTNYDANNLPICANALLRTITLRSKNLSTRCVTLTVNNLGTITVGDPVDC